MPFYIHRPTGYRFGGVNIFCGHGWPAAIMINKNTAIHSRCDEIISVYFMYLQLHLSFLCFIFYRPLRCAHDMLLCDIHRHRFGVTTKSEKHYIQYFEHFSHSTVIFNCSCSVFNHYPSPLYFTKSCIICPVIISSGKYFPRIRCD